MTKQKKDKNLRLYAFPHRWLSPIQKGIQTSHAVAELMLKGEKDSAAWEATEWARDHKTLIMFEGGPSAYLNELVGILKGSDFAWADFHEDEYSLEGARTAVVVVVDKNRKYDDSIAGMKLMEFMKDCKLASS